MKKIIGILLSGAFAFGLANCGSDDNGGGAPAAPAPGVADGARGIHFQGDENTISWTSARNDIYIGDGDSTCVHGLNQGADDTLVDDKKEELEALLNSGIVGKGTKEKASNQSRYITIEYSDGESKTYNLDGDLASVEEEYLNNGDKILAYYKEVSEDLEEYGQNNCTNGKGDKY